MFTMWKTKAIDPGLDPAKVASARFLSGGRDCTPKERLGGRSDKLEGRPRRPLMGLQGKERTVARIWIEGPDGPILPVSDGTGDLPFTSFLLQKVHEQRAEKAQIIETFGAPYVAMFGEKPQINVFQGALLNAKNFQWRSEFWRLYADKLRGTRCAETKSILRIVWDDIMVSGYMLSADAREDSSTPFMIGFSFTFLVTEWSSLASYDYKSYETEYLSRRDSEVLDRSSRRWLILSPAMKAWIAHGGMSKLQAVLSEFGVDAADSDTARHLFESLSNPVAKGVDEMNKLPFARKGQRAAMRVENAVDRFAGGHVGEARKWLTKNVVCLNAGWSRLMYGAGEILGTTLAPAALTTGGIRRLTGGDTTIGETFDDVGKIAYSIEKAPETRDVRETAETTELSVSDAWGSSTTASGVELGG